MVPELTDKQRRTTVDRDRSRLIQTNECKTYLTIGALILFYLSIMRQNLSQIQSCNFDLVEE